MGEMRVALWQVIGGLAVFGLTLLLVMTRPRGLSEAATALLGAAAMVALGLVSPAEVTLLWRDNWNVFLFFLGLMLIAVQAEAAGFFDWLAAGAGRAAGGSQRRLLVNVFAIGVLITAFLSNDATALILTPVIHALVTRLGLRPLPYLYACTFIADTASFLLPVSNPINIILLTVYPAGLDAFLWHLLPASLAAIGLNVLLFVWLFRREVRGGFDTTKLAAPALADRGLFRYTVAVLGLTALAYVVAAWTHVPLSLVALGGAAALLLGEAARGRVPARRLAREISWPIFGFIGGMLVVVRGVEATGLTALVGAAIPAVAGNSLLGALALTAGGTAIGANLINNVPFTLVMAAALGAPAVPAADRQPLVYAVMLGADLGPNLTTVGSLATMLWLLLLRRRGLSVSPVAYFRLGLVVTPPMLLAGVLMLWVATLAR
jgi:arsenical pump membrane protein